MIPPTEADIIEAKEQVLVYYFLDLMYIQAFQLFKTNPLNPQEYIDNYFGFKSFLLEFQVIRNVKTGMLIPLLKSTNNKIKSNNPDNVDEFKEEIRVAEITSRNNNMTSLCSKILFLNNPIGIMPFDRNVKTAICYEGNIYNHFLNNIILYNNEYQVEINNFILSVTEDMQIIETIFNRKHPDTNLNFLEIRNKRILDKLLWTIGRRRNQV